MSDLNVVGWGQSNFITYLNDGPAPYTPTDRVQILNNVTGQLEEMIPGHNTGGPNNPTDWGPIVQFANAWLADNPTGTLSFAVVDHGSTGLAQDPAALDWSPASTGELYSQLVTAAHTLVSLTGAPIGAVLGMQGEQDAATQAAAQAYQVNETDLIAHMRADFGDVNTVFDFGRISSQTGLPYLSDVRAAQDAVAAGDGMVTSIDTDSLPLEPDNLHFAEPGVVSLGDAMYQAYAYAPRSTVGTAANDAIMGQAGDDTLSSGLGEDTICGGSGHDVLQGNAGNDVLQGNVGNDTLSGGQGDDLIHGGQGNDLLFGNLGNDTLVGDKGDDTLSGGAGANLFVEQAGTGHDVITDFSTDPGNTVQIEDHTSATIAYSGVDTVVTLSSGDTVTLQSVHFDLTGAGWLVT